MTLSLSKTQAVSDLAEFIADFLPGKPHPYADQSISFRGVATNLGLASYWTDTSKTPAVTSLLEGALEHDPKRFCTVVLETVRRGIRYRQKKNPITRDDINILRGLLVSVGFKIKELEDPIFLQSLPSAGSGQPNSGRKRSTVDMTVINRLKDRLTELASFAPVPRGLAFEGFLSELFQAFELAPRAAFRLVGEQIDGSCDVSGHTYLVEAKWKSERTGQGDLLILSGKVGGKAQWARGLFISFGGFTQEGLDAFRIGKQTNLICMDRADLHAVLSGQIHLADLIQRKSRRAVEANMPFVPAAELLDASIS
jgi:hypothetical protein